ncbi:uncharacterized protein LOC134222302 [Armigeres subalbatus]|uniref:uncharacterized protein LOC134222302 n=1 Tax=Armigeres subalbatus TaxID=124917 RepID=UPI002ED4DE4D
MKINRHFKEDLKSRGAPSRRSCPKNPLCKCNKHLEEQRNNCSSLRRTRRKKSQGKVVRWCVRQIPSGSRTSYSPASTRLSSSAFGECQRNRWILFGVRDRPAFLTKSSSHLTSFGHRHRRRRREVKHAIATPSPSSPKTRLQTTPSPRHRTPIGHRHRRRRRVCKPRHRPPFCHRHRRRRRVCKPRHRPPFCHHHRRRRRYREQARHRSSPRTAIATTPPSIANIACTEIAPVSTSRTSSGHRYCSSEFNHRHRQVGSRFRQCRRLAFSSHRGSSPRNVDHRTLIKNRWRTVVLNYHQTARDEPHGRTSVDAPWH